MAEVNPLDTIVGQTDTKFKETVEELSGGKIKIDLQASGVLGSENDVLDTMLGGGGIHCIFPVFPAFCPDKLRRKEVSASFHSLYICKP